MSKFWTYTLILLAVYFGLFILDEVLKRIRKRKAGANHDRGTSNGPVGADATDE